MKREDLIKTSAERLEIIAPMPADGLCAAGKRRGRPGILEKWGGCK